MVLPKASIHPFPTTKPLLPYIMELDEILLALSWSAVIKQLLLGGVIIECV